MARSHIFRKEERDRIDRCPKCGSVLVEMYDKDTEDKMHFEFMECGECGCEYTEIYTYTFTEYMEEF